MSSVFQNAIATAFETMRCVAGIEITYHRGNDWSRLVAVAGKTDFKLSDEFGGIVESRSRDFVLNACDLVVGGEQITPKRGDLIKEAVGDKTHVHEVMRPDSNEQPWRYADHGRSAIRVHTKLKEMVNR